MFPAFRANQTSEDFYCRGGGATSSPLPEDNGCQTRVLGCELPFCPNRVFPVRTQKKNRKRGGGRREQLSEDLTSQPYRECSTSWEVHSGSRRAAVLLQLTPNCRCKPMVVSKFLEQMKSGHNPVLTPTSQWQGVLIKKPSHLW